MTYKFRDSKLEMYYTVYTAEKYVDVSYRVNWNEKHYVFKLETPVEKSEHIASVPYGSLQRGADDRDRPFSGWLRADGITFIADGIFAYNMADNVLGLTVLRSPIFGDLRLGEIDYEEDYPILSQGITEGKVRICFDGSTWDATDHFLNPPIVIDECNHDGELPAQHSYYSVEGKGVTLSAVKKCEFDDGEIYRLFETEGQSKTAQLHTPAGDYTIALVPWEIKTLKQINGTLTEVYMTEDETLPE